MAYTSARSTRPKAKATPAGPITLIPPTALPTAKKTRMNVPTSSATSFLAMRSPLQRRPASTSRPESQSFAHDPETASGYQSLGQAVGPARAQRRPRGPALGRRLLGAGRLAWPSRRPFGPRPSCRPSSCRPAFFAGCLLAGRLLGRAAVLRAGAFFAPPFSRPGPLGRPCRPAIGDAAPAARSRVSSSASSPRRSEAFVVPSVT